MRLLGITFDAFRNLGSIEPIGDGVDRGLGAIHLPVATDKEVSGHFI